MTDSLKYVGKNIPLHDIRQKVTGSMKYLGDMDLGNMLHIKLVLSSVANGKVIKIDTSLAEKVPGVVKIYSYANTSSTKYSGSAWFKGENTPETETMFSQRVRFVGDRVAAVVAETPEAAKKAAELVKVEYEEYEPVLNVEDYLKDCKGKLHEDEPDYYVKEISCGNIEDAMEKAYKVFYDEVETQKIHHAAIENHICVAVPNPLEGITVYSPCQIVYGVQSTVAQILNMPLNRVRVVKVPVGGSFGGKQETVLEPICAYIAMDLNRPVKLEFERRESMLSTRTRNATKGYVKTAVDKIGHIIARDIKVILDAGAYTSGGCKVSIAAGKKSFRLYRIPNQRYKGIVVNTNTPIGGACRGYGSPQIHAITEISMDNVAKSMGIDPVDFRLMHLVQPYDDDPTGAPNLGNSRIIDCVKKG
ncbi:MAG TPA: molybdopterin-dependent oxidoreductase, partial [Clostridiales bacterium]|nr:molybdopterin-dependent oxidoreductase [Clostridiales bacterium]